MFSAKKHKNALAVCDSKLIGKVVREGEKILDLNKYASFYGEKTEERIVEEWLVESFSKRHSLNLVGEKSVGLAIKVLSLKAKPFFISGVPMLQVYFV